MFCQIHISTDVSKTEAQGANLAKQVTFTTTILLYILFGRDCFESRHIIDILNEKTEM